MWRWKKSTHKRYLGQVGKGVWHFLDTVDIFRTHSDVPRQDHLERNDLDNNNNRIDNSLMYLGIIGENDVVVGLEVECWENVGLGKGDCVG